ncbi:hypothetical protein H8959_004155, partial [Pygathrix nigripes]
WTAGGAGRLGCSTQNRDESMNNLETVHHNNPKADKLKEKPSEWSKRHRPQHYKHEDAKEMPLTWVQDEIWCHDSCENDGKSENWGNFIAKEEEKPSHQEWDPGEHTNAYTYDTTI